jgi:hypothetical protein
MNASFDLVPVDGLITVTAGFTPASNVHEPESMYCRFYWLPDIGPSAYLAFLFLNMWLPSDEGASISVRLRRVRPHSWNVAGTTHQSTRPTRRIPPRLHTPARTINALPQTSSPSPQRLATDMVSKAMPNPRCLPRRTPPRRIKTC